MEKLCALHAIGELSASERKELDNHLISCEGCRSALRDFEQIALVDLTAIAAGRAQEESFNEPSLRHPDQMLSRILLEEEARSESQSEIPVSAPELGAAQTSRWTRLFGSWNLGSSLGWAVACLALVMAVHFARQDKHTTDDTKPDLKAVLERAQSEEELWKSKAQQVQRQQQLSVQQLDRIGDQKASAVAALEALQSSYSELQRKKTAIEQQLADETAKLLQKEGDLQATRASLDQERQQVRLLDTELKTATSTVAEARDRMAHLTQASEKKISAPAFAPEPRVTDAEAREIFGARDLHIVDVYDVDRSGKTRRTYGRVYYVNHSLLLFYAFDLADRKNNRKAAGFQAWGFREPNSSKPENLGLFYVDDASLNRWVLRVSNADVLSRIDTVFVTLEPPQGSTFPRGPKLLFASLGGPANHP